MSKEKTLVPKLRFKDFDNEWERNPIGSVFTFKQGVQCPIEEQFSEPSSGLIRFIRIIDLTQPNEPPRYIKDPGKNHHVKDSELFMVRYGSPGLIGFGYEGVIANNLFRLLPTDLERHDMTFYSQLLGSLKKQIDAVSGSSTMPAISFTTLRAIHITTPPLPEQKKIAAFLTSVDDRIDQLKRKKSLLQDYKKGVMQKLFSQELRFKDDDGTPYPNWEEKTLGEIYSYITTNSFSRDSLNYESGEVFNIHYGDIHTKYRCHFYLSNENVPYLNDTAEQLRIKEECYVQAGDIVLADASEDYADIGKSIEIMDIEDQKVIAGLHTYILRPNLSQMSVGFGAYLMQARPTRLEVMRVAQGTKVLGLPKGYLSEINLKIPTKPEQAKISDLLTALDRKIEQVTTQITETQTFKKGLLQQMFV